MWGRHGLMVHVQHSTPKPKVPGSNPTWGYDSFVPISKAIDTQMLGFGPKVKIVQGSSSYCKTVLGSQRMNVCCTITAQNKI